MNVQGLRTRGAALPISDGAIGAGGEERFERRRVAEVDRRRVHERREPVFVDRVDGDAGLRQLRDDVRAIGDRGPVQQVHAGAFDEIDFRTRTDERADDIRAAERDGF